MTADGDTSGPSGGAGTGPKPPYPPSKGSADLMFLLAPRAQGTYDTRVSRSHRSYARWCAARALILRVI